MSAYRLKGSIGGVPTVFVLDTGAAVTLLHKNVWDRAKAPGTKLKPWDGPRLVRANGTAVVVHGYATLPIQLADKTYSTCVVVAESLTAEGILGLDFLESNECTVETGKRLLRFPKSGIAVPICRPEELVERPHTVGVVLQETLRIPARSEMEVMAGIPANGTLLVENEPMAKLPVMVARAVVCPDASEAPVRLLNPTSEAVTVYKGTKIAVAEALDESNVRTIAAVSTAARPRQDTKCEAEKQKFLTEAVERAGENLSGVEMEQLLLLLQEYGDVFAASQSDFGRTGEVHHEISTGNAPPIRQRVRRIAPSQRAEAKKLLKEMLEKDVIQPSSSPWASPIVLVSKKDGSTRFCVDYRKLNSLTRKDAYPLPRVDDTLDTLAGAKWFTTLDLISGYWQVEMSCKDREKTAFCTPEGLFEFKVMPFGLCNAPATFQRLMDMILAGLQWSNCLVYLDDVIIVGKTFEDHLCNLRDVLERLRSAGLTLQPAKCAFCRKEVHFLGHIVSERGVATGPAKTEKVVKWPEPVSLREIQQFLGLTNYYRRLVEGYANIAKPLHRLTEKTSEFKWTKECQEAFEELRRRLVSTPVLAFPDYSRPFILDTDASDLGIGGVLSQVQSDGSERVIAYASRVLSKAERRYCVTRRELLAVVTFARHFRPYLLGRHFTLRTDHGSLTWLRNFREPEGQLARWLEQLQEYDFDIVHRQGRKHGNADALSRLPCRQCGRENHSGTEANVASVSINNCDQSLEGHTREELRQLQQKDPSVGPILRDLETHQKPTPDEAKSMSNNARRLVQMWDQLEMKDGLLWRNFEDHGGTMTRRQLVVPRVLREEILQELHAGAIGGHLGEEKTLGRLKERFYWPGHWNEVRDWCRTCASCATRKTAAPKRRAPLQSIKVGYPMQLVAVDILGPLPESDHGNSYVLVAADYFTRWTEAYAIPNQEAKTVAEKLTNELFFRFSPPEQLHSDQGRQFESELIAEVCKLLQIQKTRTTAYHPQYDGLVERFNRTLLDMLATCTKDHPFDWENHIRKVCMAYNTSVQSTTGYTPFYLMFGRQAKLPVDLMYGTDRPLEMSPDGYAAELRKTLTEAYDRVRESMGTQLGRQKEFYDQKVHGQPFKDNDRVWLHSPAVPRRKSRKLHHPWSGPWQVVKRLSDATYRIQNLQQRRRRLVVHFDRLKPCAENIRLENTTARAGSSSTPPQDRHTPTAPHFGEQLEAVDDDLEPDTTTHRYPTRTRQPPARLGDYVTH